MRLGEAWVKGRHPRCNQNSLREGVVRISALTIIDGDLFKTDAKYICHQCNCVTRRAAGLAAKIFRRYPWADIYSGRPEHRKPADGQMPGDIVVKGNGENERFVINMLAQLYPGKSRFPDDAADGFKARQTAFANCLLKILCIPNLHSVAFPWKIGCCMAGGDWDTYLPIIEKFSDKARANVLIYRLPPR